MIGHGPGLGIDDEGFASLRHAQRTPDQLQLVGEDRQVGRAGDAFEIAVLGGEPGVEHREVDVLVLEALLDLQQRRLGALRHRIALGEGDNDDGRPVLEVVKFVAHAGLVGEHEVVDARAGQLDGFRGGGCAQGDGGHGSKEPKTKQAELVRSIHGYLPDARMCGSRDYRWGIVQWVALRGNWGAPTAPAALLRKILHFAGRYAGVSCRYFNPNPAS